MTQFTPTVQNAIATAATAHGVDPQLMSTIAAIESSGNPAARTGSYSGLYQLSPSEFAKYGGGSSDIYDPNANANAAAQKIGDESAAFQSQYGRAPTAGEIYLIHQQGAGGAAAHMANPDAPAWENMASTGEGRQKGDGWAKQAIWGNVPADVRAQYPGGVDSLTSQQFMDIWNNKVARFGGGTATADATPTDPNIDPKAVALTPAPVQVAQNAVPPVSSPSPAANSSQAAPSNPIAQLLGYIGAQNSNAPTASNSGQQSQPAGIDPSTATRTAVAQASQQANASADANSAIQMPTARPIDLSKLRAALAARQAQGIA